MSDKKYKEFWIRRREPDDQGFSEWQIHGPGFWLETANLSKFTHVIEAQALTELEEQNRMLVEFIKKTEGYMFHLCQPDNGNTFGEWDDLRRQALAKIEERK